MLGLKSISAAICGEQMLASAPLRASAYAMGKATALLRIHMVGICFYIVLFYVVTGYVGLIGPGLASVATSILTFLLTARLIARMGKIGPKKASQPIDE